MSVGTLGESARSRMMDVHRALETTTDDYVERVAQGSDHYAALLRRLEAAHRLPAGRSRAPAPAPAQLPHMLDAVDSTLDGMIKRLERELQHRTSTDDSHLRPPPPPPHDAADTALSAQLRRVIASGRSQVERELLANALREAESETIAAASTHASLTAQLSVPRLLANRTRTLTRTLTLTLTLTLALALALTLPLTLTLTLGEDLA